MKIKTTETHISTLRIMKNSNQSFTQAYLIDLKQSQGPIVFTNLSVSSNGVYFLNSYSRGRTKHSTKVVTFPFSSTENFDVIGCVRFVGDVNEVKSTHDDKTNVLRDLLIYDTNDSMPLTLWNDFIEQIKEDGCIRLLT